MRNFRVHLIAIVIALTAAWLTWDLFLRDAGSSPAPRPVATRSETTAGSAAPVPASGSATTASSSVRRLTPEARRALGEQITAAARKAQAAGSAGAATVEGLPILRLEDLDKAMLASLNDAIPLLAPCFPATKSTALALMQMTSDPELGTVIDTDEIKDEGGAKLDAKIDTCLRDVIDSLALPPIGKPGKLQVQYSFRFD